MKVLLLVVLFFFTTNLFAQKVMFISGIETKNSIDTELKDQIYYNLISNLQKTNKFIVAGGNQKEIDQGVRYNEECIGLEECSIREGQKQAADIILGCKISRVNKKYTIVITMYDLATRELLGSEMKKGLSIDQLTRESTYLLFQLLTDDENDSSNETKQVVFVSDPPGAMVWVDENEYETNIIVNLKVGVHDISFVLEGHNSSGEKILIAKMDKEPKKIIRKLTRPKGYLELNSLPLKSLVFINGKKMKTNKKQFRLNSGEEISILIKKNKYLNWHKVITLLPNDHQSITVDLEPEMGVLLLKSVHENAVVLIDEKKKGVILDGVLRIKNVKTEKEMRLRLRIKGFYEFDELIKLSANEVYHKSISLKKIQKAVIYLDHLDSSSTIYLDGKKVQSIKSHKVEPSIKHELKITKKNHKDLDFVFNLAPGEKKYFDTNLKRVPGSIKINIIPNFSYVFIDGKKRFIKDSFSMNNLSSQKKISIKIVKDDYETYRKDVFLKPGEVRKIDIKLKLNKKGLSKKRKEVKNSWSRQKRMDNNFYFGIGLAFGETLDITPLTINDEYESFTSLPLSLGYEYRPIYSFGIRFNFAYSFLATSGEEVTPDFDYEWKMFSTEADLSLNFYLHRNFYLGLLAGSASTNFKNFVWNDSTYDVDVLSYNYRQKYQGFVFGFGDFKYPWKINNLRLEYRKYRDVDQLKGSSVIMLHYNFKLSM